MDPVIETLTAVRLDTRSRARGNDPTLSSVGAFVGGLPFIGLGLWVSLRGSALVVELATTLVTSTGAPQALAWHAEQIVGGMLVFVGAWFWVLCLEHLHLRFARESRRLANPGRPELADHAWDVRGESTERLLPVRRAFSVAVVLTLFALPFHWWAWRADADRMWWLMLGVADLWVLFLWVEFVSRLWHALKFGASRLEYRRFPYRRGEVVDLHWWPPPGVLQANAGRYTLRCVSEWYEQKGSGRNRSRSLVHEARWQGVAAFTAPRAFSPGMPVPLSFAIPADLPVTRLTTTTPVFWELEVALDLPGLDFVETYLVPVY